MAKGKNSGSGGSKSGGRQSSGRRAIASVQKQSGKAPTQNVSRTHSPPKTKPGGGKSKK